MFHTPTADRRCHQHSTTPHRVGVRLTALAPRTVAVWLLVLTACLRASSLQADEPWDGPSLDSRPPNIVLIVSDDQAWTDYGFMGHRQIETPHLDRLASESAVFSRGYVPTALCRPSLATLVTGLYAHQHRITGNDPGLLPEMRGANRVSGEPEAYQQQRAKLISFIDQHPTVPKLLAARGYVSHQSGKWWEGNYRRGGFTQGMTRGFPEPGGRHGDDGLKIGRESMQPLLEFIDQSDEAQSPFFVWYAPFLPHTPHNPPHRLFEKYKRKGVESDSIANYYAMVEWFDETCGELLQHLEDQNLRQNTLVIYVGDNGWIQLPDGNGFAPRSKQSAYEGGTRQPTMFSWPGVIKPGVRGEQLCSSVDIAPTILAAAKADVPGNLPGFNLLPILQTGAPTPRQEVYGETFAHDIADLEQPEASLLYRWVIVDRWKLLLTYDGNVGRDAKHHPQQELRPQLYDLIADPHEERNQADMQPELVKQLADKLQQWWPVTQRTVQTE
jgi:arylsulfatase A-like enzyme